MSVGVGVGVTLGVGVGVGVADVELPPELAGGVETPVPSAG